MSLTADVGRSTFYAHYASKEALLEELCHDLFHHLFTGREDADVKTLLVHIFKHFRTNQDRVASLCCPAMLIFLENWKRS